MATAAEVFCGACGSRNPAASRFCGNCGQPIGVGARSHPGAPAQYGARTFPRLKRNRRWVWLLVLGAGGYLIVVLAALAVILAPTQTSCQEPCLTPPVAPALPPPQQYKSSAYGYSLEYYGAAPTVEDSKTVRWSLNGGWGYGFTGEPAQGRSAEQMVEQVQRTQYPDAVFVFQIPAAGLGYNAGYGAVYDLNVNPGTGQPAHARLILIASVKRDLAIEMIALGPYEPETKGHPNPAATWLAHMLGGVVNSVVFPGDVPK